MYHGEELVKAHATLRAPRVETLPGSRDAANARSDLNAASTQTTVPLLISQAVDATGFARDRLDTLEALSNRAVSLAERLTGPLALPGEDASGPGPLEKERPPAAALEALGLSIGDMRRPLVAMADPFQRLALALNAIEEALG